MRYAAFFGYQQDPIDQALARQDFPLIGTDEVGNGSYFGGLAVVASLVSPEQHARLKSLGVGDSKTLDDRKIRALAPILKQEIPHQALLLTPKKIQSGHRLWLQCGICQGCSSQSSHFFALATRGKSSKDCSRCLYDQEKL